MSQQPPQEFMSQYLWRCCSSWVKEKNNWGIRSCLQWMEFQVRGEHLTGQGSVFVEENIPAVADWGSMRAMRPSGKCPFLEATFGCWVATSFGDHSVHSVSIVLFGRTWTNGSRSTLSNLHSSSQGTRWQRWPHCRSWIFLVFSELWGILSFLQNVPIVNAA